MKNKFSQAIVLSMVTLSSVALLTACSSHKESSSADKMPKSSQVTSSSKAKTSSKDSGKVSKSSAKVKESSGSKTESSSVPSSKKASAPSSSSSQAQSSSSNSSSVPSSSQSQAPKSSASQSQAPKSSSDSQAQAKTDTQVTTVDMDVSAVARGQFDSIAGTWKSSDGSRLVFNNTSLVGDITPQGQATSHIMCTLKMVIRRVQASMKQFFQEIEVILLAMLGILALSLKRQLFLVLAMNKIPFK